MTTHTPPEHRADVPEPSESSAPPLRLARWKRWLFGFVMFSLVIGALQLAAYGYLRAFQGYDGRHLMQFEFDPYKNILPTRNYVDTRGIRHNSVGFRRSGEISIAKPPGTIRVFLMGASTAYGLGGLWTHIEPRFKVIRNEDTIDAFLERRLASEFPGAGIEVINAAITSTWTHHNLIYLLQSVMRYEPDMVLFLDGFNDFFHARPNHDQFASYAYNLTARVIEGEPTLYSLATMNGWWMFRKFALAHVAGRAARHAKLMVTTRDPDRIPIDPQAMFTSLKEVFPRNAGAMHEYLGVVLAHRGIDAVFMLQPMLILERERTTATPIERELFAFNVRSYLENYETFMKLATPWIVDQERAMAQRVGASFIDLTGAFRGVPEQVYTDYCHLTPRGNEIVAGMIADSIVPRLQKRSARPPGAPPSRASPSR